MLNQENTNIVQINYKNIDNLFFPYYEPGQDNVLPFVTNVIMKFSNLFSILDKIDQNIQLQTIDQKQKLIHTIRDNLNKICKQCHRSEIINAILDRSSRFHNNLKHIPVAKEFTTISKWPKVIKIQKPTSFIESLKKPLKHEIITIMDHYYLHDRQISRIKQLLISNPKALILNFHFQNCLFSDEHFSKLPKTHLYFIGIIAASTLGSRYLWNFMVEKFMSEGGQIEWLLQGIQSQKIPVYLKKLSEISCHMALNPRRLLTSEYLQNFSQLQISPKQILRSFIALSYYQMLACICRSLGLIPENTNNQKFLPVQKFTMPSLESFQLMKKIEENNEIHQKIIGEEFTSYNNSWVMPNDEVKRVKDEMSDSEEEQQQIGIKTIKQTNLLQVLEEQEIFHNLHNLKTVQNIREMFGKFTHFCEHCFGESEGLKVIQNVPHHSQKKIMKRTKKLIFREEDYICASQWNFSSHVVPILEKGIGANFANIIRQFLSSFYREEKQKRRDIQAYYESLHNYMYEHVDYVKLMNEKISATEKQFIKLVTKSPFLLNEESISKLMEELHKSDIVQYVLEICSYKFRFNIMLLVLLYDKFYFEE